MFIPYHTVTLKVSLSHQTVFSSGSRAPRGTMLIATVARWRSFAPSRALLGTVQLCHWRWEQQKLSGVSKPRNEFVLLLILMPYHHRALQYFKHVQIKKIGGLCAQICFTLLLFAVNKLRIDKTELTSLTVLRTRCPTWAIEAAWVTFSTCWKRNIAKHQLKNLLTCNKLYLCLLV